MDVTESEFLIGMGTENLKSRENLVYMLAAYFICSTTYLQGALYKGNLNLFSRLPVMSHLSLKGEIQACFWSDIEAAGKPISESNQSNQTTLAVPRWVNLNRIAKNLLKLLKCFK